MKLTWENLWGFLSELLGAEKHQDVCGYTAYVATAPSTGNCLQIGPNVGGFSSALTRYFLIQPPNPFSSDTVTPHKTKRLVDLVVYNNETGICNLEIFFRKPICLFVF